MAGDRARRRVAGRELADRQWAGVSAVRCVLAVWGLPPHGGRVRACRAADDLESVVERGVAGFCGSAVWGVLAARPGHGVSGQRGGGGVSSLLAAGVVSRRTR